MRFLLAALLFAVSYAQTVCDRYVQECDVCKCDGAKSSEQVNGVDSLDACFQAAIEAGVDAFSYRDQPDVSCSISFTQAQCKQVAATRADYNWRVYYIHCQTENGESESTQWSCQSGQKASGETIAQSNDNSEESCGAACDADSSCYAFDYTTTSSSDACRLAKKSLHAFARLGNGGAHNRMYCSPSRHWVTVGGGMCRIEVDGKFKRMEGLNGYMDTLDYLSVSNMEDCKAKCISLESNYGGTCISVAWSDHISSRNRCSVNLQGVEGQLETIKSETGAFKFVIGNGAQKDTVDATKVLQVTAPNVYTCAAYSEPRTQTAPVCDFNDLVYDYIVPADCPLDLMEFHNEKKEHYDTWDGNTEHYIDYYHDNYEFGVPLEDGGTIIDGCLANAIRSYLSLGAREGLCECDHEDEEVCHLESSPNCGNFEVYKWSCPPETTTTTTTITTSTTTTTTTGTTTTTTASTTTTTAEATDSDTAIDVVVTDPCSCPEGTGWSRSKLGCFEDSTTACDECPTMGACEAGSCAAGCYGYMPLRMCQCTPSCLEFGNCCQDAQPCMTCQEQSWCSENIPCNGLCTQQDSCPCTCGHIPTQSPSPSPTATVCDVSQEEDFCQDVPCEELCDPTLCPCTCPDVVDTRVDAIITTEENLMAFEVIPNSIFQTITQALALCGAFASLYYIYQFFNKKTAYAEVREHEEI